MLLTGATSGIGQAKADAARWRVRVLATGRNEERLAELCRESQGR
jgi:NADP-dependent 3-hydroxy acid dehydrogenase YdfG